MPTITDNMHDSSETDHVGCYHPDCLGDDGARDIGFADQADYVLHIEANPNWPIHPSGLCDCPGLAHNQVDEHICPNCADTCDCNARVSPRLCFCRDYALQDQE